MATAANAPVAAAAGVNLIIGTTGLTSEQKTAITEAVAKNKVAAVMSTNYSIGVGVFFKLIEEAATYLGDDYDVEIIEKNSQAGGRLNQIRATREAEFAILVTDAHQRSGLGTELLRRLVEIGRREGRKRITGDVLPENTGMQRAAQKLGFKIRFHEGLARAEMDLA